MELSYLMEYFIGLSCTSNIAILLTSLNYNIETEKTWIGMIKISADEVQIHVILIGHTGVGKISL